MVSVAAQEGVEVEHIVIDGGSRDGTLEIIARHRDRISVLVSEPDGGIYDAMNKGLALATGDVVGFLNSDDIYAAPDALSSVQAAFADLRCQAIHGDVAYVAQDDLSRVLRHWTPNPEDAAGFRRGWHPPHPCFFVRRELVHRYGGFDLTFRIAADYEWMLRYVKRYQVALVYVPKLLVKMRVGGVSNGSLLGILRANIECYLAWRKNGLSANPLMVITKPLAKLAAMR